MQNNVAPKGALSARELSARHAREHGLDRRVVARTADIGVQFAQGGVTDEGAEATLEAVELGAVDFVAKPGGPVSLEIDRLRQQHIAV